MKTFQFTVRTNDSVDSSDIVNALAQLSPVEVTEAALANNSESQEAALASKINAANDTKRAKTNFFRAINADVLERKLGALGV